MPSQESNRPARAKAFLQSLPSRTSGAVRSAKWQRRAAGAVLALLVVWGVAYAAVPWIAKSQIEKIATEKLGRQVRVGSVDFKPWSLELTVNELSVARAAVAPGAPSPGTSPQLSIKRIYIDGELQSLLRLAPVIDAISVDEPVVSLTHFGDGRYDIDDVLQRLQPAADAPPSDPQRFALYNLVLSGGRVDFNDESVHRVHELRALNLSVPFLSNLASKREVKTSPHLSFTLNGSSFDTAAVGTPFAQTRKTDATITLRSLDLNPYLGYWPASLPFRLQSAVLQADVKVAFEQTPATVVRVSGTVSAEKVRLTSRSTAAAAGKAAVPGGELLAFERLQLALDDVRPLDRVVKLSAVELSAPTLDVVRDRAGRLNILPPADVPVASKTAPRPNAARAASAPAAPTSAASAPAVAAAVVKAAAPWNVQVGRVAVRSGVLNWRDDTLSSPAQIRLADLTLDASAIAVPFAANAPLQFSGSFGLGQTPVAVVAPAAPTAASAKNVKGAKNAKAVKTARPVVTAKAAPATPAPTAQMRFKGTATDQAAQVDATVAGWPLNMAAKYVGQFLLPALNGQLDAELGVHWEAAREGKPQVLNVTAPQLAVSDVLLAEGKTSLVSLKRVELAQVGIDVTGQTFTAAKMQLTQPKARIERGADKRWMYERWMVGQGGATSAPTPTSAPPPTTDATRAQAPSWSVAINDVQLDGGAVSFSDRAGGKPVAFEVTALKAQLGKLQLGQPSATTGRATRPATAAMPLTASLQLTAGRFNPGKLDFNGSLNLTPVQAQGQLTLNRLPVQAFEPYFADAVNIELLRADASFKGRVAYKDTAAGPQAQVAGDLALEEFRANTLAPSEDLLAWKALNLRGLNVALEPAKATRVNVRETVVTDFFARVIVMPDGRINLQDLLKPPAASADASAQATQTTREAGAAKTVAVAPPTPPAAATPSGPAPVINFGPMSLVNGKVLFSDRFVKPNYSADLSELTGKLSAFSSVAGPAGAAPAMADLELRGKAENTASLEILGQLNPLAKPLALDIKGKVRDLELPPLSPYAVKYSGYGITRGKLDVDVAYVVLPDGRLTATNKVVLNQLSFGDKVAGSTASLPVKLAVALLADRNGVIDLDLPISGSLNDPQFSIGPIIIKVILNVIVKAVTAPFSLLANAFGGSADELGVVNFAAGSAVLAPAAQEGLDKVAKALTDRPSLRLTVVGTSSLEVEREGYKRERLNDLVQAEKRRRTVKDGGTATAAVTVTPAEYPALLKEVYQHTDMPKPRNLVGMQKDQPVPEMEKLLLADIKVSDDAIRELAVRRGVAVKDYLAGRGLAQDRLFLGAAKAVPPEAKWTPRAELNLATP